MIPVDEMPGLGLTERSEVAAIGGYFELESASLPIPHADGIFLNSGRACLEYLLRARGETRLVHLPLYTCDVMLQPLQRLGIPHRFYPIDANLKPELPESIGPADLLVVNNYFGLLDELCARLADRFGERLLIDNSQAWFAPAPLGGAFAFYSPRKFMGLPDGGVLVGPDLPRLGLPKGTSWSRSTHLLRRADEGAEAGFEDFQRNDLSLTAEPLQCMSRVTRGLLGSIDHEAIRLRRVENFQALELALGNRNGLRWKRGVEGAGPLAYPFLTDDPALRKRLRDSRIYTATYWPNVLNWAPEDSWERQLAEQTIALPIDQRYGSEDMDRILEVLA